MIESRQLLTDLKKLTKELVNDLRARCDAVAEVGDLVDGQYQKARSAGRTDRSREEWREDLLAQVAVGWVLGTVFIRFCEDNRLYDTPLLSGPSDRRRLAGDHRADWLADNPAAGDREWLEEVFSRYRDVTAMAELFGAYNALWQFGPSADGAKMIVNHWRALDDETGQLVHDFTDLELDTRFLGDLYQDLSDHAKKTFALLQTPKFVEDFILERTLDPAIETFGLSEVRMIDPTCGSGHFLLGSFDRILELWRDREPGTPVRELVQRALDSVNGVDLNPFAAAIARFRLLVAALRVSGITQLADAPRFRINIAVGDSLLHGRRSGELFAGTEGMDPLLRHRYPTENEDRANELLETGRYHAVVGNPPYITVKDKALRDAYRSRYETCYRQYSLGVPFTERFVDLAAVPTEAGAAGYVGMITANSFMKREFGKKLVEEYLPRVDLTHVIDTSGAHIPGHGTPTVILLARHQAPVADTIRTVLGIRGEPSRPDDPERGQVWSSIRTLVDEPGSENDFVSVEDAPRDRFASHPWSLQGGAASAVMGLVEIANERRLDKAAKEIGFGVVTREDDAFRIGSAAARRAGIEEGHIRALVAGEEVRDWSCSDSTGAIWPYDPETLGAESDAWLVRFLWRYRRQLSERVAYGKTQLQRGLKWWEYSMFFSRRFKTPLSITFAFVATHNHFVLDRGGKVFKRTAPIIKLPETATEQDHLQLLGLLNSSTACFWMKQVFHNKGGGGIGGGIAEEAWEQFLEFDGTKLKQFPIPRGSALELATALDTTARELASHLPSMVVSDAAPSQAALSDACSCAEDLRARMVALQEELDWHCYSLYGLTEDELTHPTVGLPTLEKGQRAFEIVLARRVAVGDIESTWFERHNSTPMTELPSEWPEDYGALVERRIELLTSDPAIGLLERPEYKRRWNWDAWEDLEEEAVRNWLLDRLEAPELWTAPTLTTTAHLTDRLRSDPEFLEAAQIYVGRMDVDLPAMVADLVREEAVPFASGHRYKGAGLRKRREWESVWEQQREEDAIDARMELDKGDPQYLTERAAKAAKREQGLDQIAVPPKYGTPDFVKSTYWRHRGKLDVPKERFILYPETHRGSDSTPVIGWAGWDHLVKAQALAGHFTQRKNEGAESEELFGLLAGLQELVPWLLQWHNEMDPTYGQPMGDFFASFADSEARALGVTVQDLITWTPQ